MLARPLIKIINDTEGERWSDLENSLGYLEIDNYFVCEDDYLDGDGDPDYWHMAYANEDIGTQLIYPIKEITMLFSEWINKLNIDEKFVIKKKDFLKLLNRNKDVFLNFNYTPTLQNIYNIDNVCHIHGKQGEKILFGHGNNSDNYENYMGSNL